VRAAVYDGFRQPLRVSAVPDPAPPAEGAVVRVLATGLCRSDWHGWMGHDPMIRLPHVPGHEFAGELAAVGSAVRRWREGQRVTAPFVNGCGQCPECLRGDAQICPNQRQPGFSHWGSFAEYVVVDFADFNLVAMPDGADVAGIASLGCRFSTAFRGLVIQGRLEAGQWLAVHGCGGLGLSAVMIGAALQARVVAIDVLPEALELAQEFGAELVLHGRESQAVPERILEATSGGAHVSLDALGNSDTCLNSILCLRRGGTHVQLGLFDSADLFPPVPMDRVLARELRLVGSHGMAARSYPRLLQMVMDGRLHPGRLIRRRVSLDDGAMLLPRMGDCALSGITVIDSFALSSAETSRRFNPHPDAAPTGNGR